MKNVKINDNLIIHPIIKNLLLTRGITTNKQIEDFLLPSLKGLHDPFLLKGMKELKERLNQAIKEKESVVIYGDYDTDGISASSMLYLFLKSRGLTPKVFIPNRFETGYGLSSETIEEIAENVFPDLLITVDCGITAVNEVEMLKDLGIDVIITDHHEPGGELPDCIIVNPKIKGQDYPFDSLCGAGVVLKIIQAMADDKEVRKYLDICAIATVGDIVPLMDENRIIARLGIDLINSDKTRNSIKLLKEQLKLSKVTSSDISFKIVPKINASGRMDNSYKAFEFFTNEDEAVLKDKLNDIIADNETRLNATRSGFLVVQDKIRTLNLNLNPGIFVVDARLNLGVIGIIASRIVNDFNRPAFIFSVTDKGVYKGSVRSINGINIHELLMEQKHLCEEIGGHELAAGLAIKQENFAEFEKNIQERLNEKYGQDIYVKSDECECTEIEVSEVTQDLIEGLKLLEPFGSGNEKPLFALNAKHFKLNRLKSYKHFNLVGKTFNIIAFNGAGYKFAFKPGSGAKLVVELEENEFKGKKYIKGMLRDIKIKEMPESDDNETEIASLIVNKYLSLNVQRDNSRVLDADKNEEIDKYSTVVITRRYASYKDYIARGIPGGYKVFLDRSCAVYNPMELLINIDFASKIILKDGEVLGSEYDHYLNNTNARIYTKKCPYKLDFSCINLNREVFALYYKSLLKALNEGEQIEANDFFEVYDHLKEKEGTLGFAQTVFCIAVFAELGFIELTLSDGLTIKKSENPEKLDLSSSKVYEAVGRTKENK